MNKEGAIVYEKEIVPGGIDIKLSGNDRYAVITRMADHSISFLDNGNGNLQWSYSIGGFDPINSPFSSIDITDEGNNIAVALSKDWTKLNNESYLYSFEISGNILWQNTYNKNIIQCSLSPKGNCLLILGNMGTFLYKNG